jgi:hypothetical protein
LGGSTGITLPSGFFATIFADKIGHARQLAVDLMSFEEFCAFVAAHPVRQLDDTFFGYSGADREAKVSAALC